MLTLLTLPPGPDVPSLSPFGVKAMLMLDMAGLDWDMEAVANPGRLPLGRAPALRLEDGALVAETDAIRAVAQERSGRALDGGPDHERRATARAFEALVEGSIYEAHVTERWSDPALYPASRDAALASAPAALRRPLGLLVRRSILRHMRSRDTGGLPEERRLARAGADLGHLAAKLGDGPFLMGEEPLAVDASAGAMLSAMAAGRGSPLGRLLAERPALVAYAERVLGLLRPRGGVSP